MDRAQRNTVVHDFRQARHVFADLDAGNAGVDWLKLAANFGGRIHFQIVHVLMGRRADQIDHDHRLG